MNKRVYNNKALQEDAAYALSDGSNQTSAFSYEIKPLNTTLSQLGNDIAPVNRNNSFKFFVGDIVKGYCPFDKKEHKGMIKYLYFTVDNERIPKYVYIQDFSNEDTLALDATTVKKVTPVRDIHFCDYRNPYDGMWNRPVYERIIDAISKGLRKSLR